MRSPTSRGVAALAAALAVGLTACAGTVARDDVASTIKAQLAQQSINAGTVSCPSDLKAEVGQSVRCEFAVDGQPVDAIATVTSVEGGKAKYDITTAARPIAEDLLARKVGQQVAQQAKWTVDSSTCDGDLAPMVNAQQSCQVVSNGTSRKLTVTVTKVDGGLISYSIEQA